MNKIKSDSDVKKILYIIFALAVGLTVIYIPLPDSIKYANNEYLTAQGQAAVGILLFSLILWLTEAIPFHITGLVAVFLMAIFRLDTFKNIVASGFGNDIFIFFLGVSVISSFITNSGLGKRISAFVISVTGNRADMIILGFITAGALLAMCLTELAAAAMLLPIARTILEEEKAEPMKSNFGKALMIAVAWGPVAGGMGTPVGSGTNPLAIGFLNDMAGINVSFLDWLAYGIPASLILIPLVWAVLLLFFKPEFKRLSKSSAELKREYKNMPPPSKDEKTAMLVFALTSLMWLTTPFLERWINIDIPISMPVLLTSCVLFFPKVSKIKWSDIEKDISWSGLILIVSGISIGMTFYKTGAAGWFSSILLIKVLALPAFARAAAIILIVSALKIVLTSNTVTGTIVIPILIALAQNSGLAVLPIVIPAALTSSLAFILVTSTPVNIIPYSEGYFSVSDMAKAGVAMTLIATVIVTLVILCVG